MTWMSRPFFIVLLCALAVAAFVAAALGPGVARGATILYPDLKTQPPKDLVFGQEVIDGKTHHVLRFTNTVWNAGEGPVEVRGQADAKGAISQILYDDVGGTTERPMPKAAIVYHPSHNHDHFQNFAYYELWDVDPNGRLNRKLRVGAKTTSCILDSNYVKSLPNSPDGFVYSDCTRDDQGISTQGMSVGYGDRYDYDLPDQWIDLGGRPLADGRYALRSVADPKNLLDEGPRPRELEEDNKAVTCFVVKDGSLRSPTRC